MWLMKIVYKSVLMHPKVTISRFYLILLISVLATTIVKAQENDFQIWGDLSAKYKINKKIKLNASIGLRSYENSQLIKKYYADFGVKYVISKRISLGAKYRFSDYHFHSKVSTHRMSFDATYSFKKWGRTRLSIRERYDYEWLVVNPVNVGDDMTLRSRITLTYDIRKCKIEPYVSIEHYLGLNGYLSGETKLLRWTMGAQMPITKWSDLQVSYRIQKQVYTNNPTIAYVFMVSYMVDIN